MRIYRWDLDKTYLATDFHSIRGLIRSATEPAHAKRNVPGSAALVRALASRGNSRIVVVSGSPTQMREVLAEKLRLDGVRYDELHLKDNVGNLKRGRIRAIRGQFGYKLPILLRGRVGVGPAVLETLFGDDAEIDALVYSVFADAVAGKVRPIQLSRIMEASGAYADDIAAALDALAKIAPADVVDRVFIHLERGHPPARFAALGTRVVPVFSWFQAALVLFERGDLDAGSVLEVLREVLDGVQGRPDAIANLAQDIVRRGFVGSEVVDRVLDGATDRSFDAVLRLASARVALLSGPRAAKIAARPEQPDYLRLVALFGRADAPEGPVG